MKLLSLSILYFLHFYFLATISFLGCSLILAIYNASEMEGDLFIDFIGIEDNGNLRWGCLVTSL